MKTESFNYILPNELIAQSPSSKRDHSQLLICQPDTQQISHKDFKDIENELNENDVLVLNDTKVFNARIFAKKKTGKEIEIFLIKEEETNIWQCLIRPTKRVQIDEELILVNQKKVRILEKGAISYIEFLSDKNIKNELDIIGSIPLPPYISAQNPNKYKDRYQTVYANKLGSVAAPTAGLHFTTTLLNRLSKKGVPVEHITLHVGYGTFKGIQTNTIQEHTMHEEAYDISKGTAARLNKYRAEGKRLIAVGTTVVRSLESAFHENEIQSGTSATTLFIRPGYQFQVIDAMITNFHLPKTSLLVLVSAFAGVEFTKAVYKEAIDEKYRFYSFGDAMYITSRSK